jgi:hypothetical protein
MKKRAVAVFLSFALAAAALPVSGADFEDQAVETVIQSDELSLAETDELTESDITAGETESEENSVIAGTESDEFYSDDFVQDETGDSTSETDS